MRMAAVDLSRLIREMIYIDENKQRKFPFWFGLVIFVVGVDVAGGVVRQK